MRDKILDVLYLFSSVFMIGLLLFVLYSSLVFWRLNFPTDLSVHAKSFYIAIGVVIVTVLAQWIEGRIKAIVKTLNNLGGKDGRKSRKEKRT